MDLVPKKKSETQLTGVQKFDIAEWIVPYAANVKKEFLERYNKLEKQYDDLSEEFFWNNLIYEIKISYEPVIGHNHYLYFKNGEYFLSIIGPHEKFNKKYYIGTFKLEHTGKWIKTN